MRSSNSIILRLLIIRAIQICLKFQRVPKIMRFREQEKILFRKLNKLLLRIRVRLLKKLNSLKKIFLILREINRLLEIKLLLSNLLVGIILI